MNSTPFFIENEKEVNKQVCKWMFGAGNNYLVHAGP